MIVGSFAVLCDLWGRAWGVGVEEWIEDEAVTHFYEAVTHFYTKNLKRLLAFTPSPTDACFAIPKFSQTQGQEVKRSPPRDRGHKASSHPSPAVVN